jgi:hypothetical protein
VISVVNSIKLASRMNLDQSFFFFFHAMAVHTIESENWKNPKYWNCPQYWILCFTCDMNTALLNRSVLAELCLSKLDECPAVVT